MVEPEPGRRRWRMLRTLIRRLRCHNEEDITLSDLETNAIRLPSVFGVIYCVNRASLKQWVHTCEFQEQEVTNPYNNEILDEQWLAENGLSSKTWAVLAEQNDTFVTRYSGTFEKKGIALTAKGCTLALVHKICTILHMDLRLTELKLDIDSDSDEGAKAIGEALKVNDGLQSLRFTSNSITLKMW